MTTVCQFPPHDLYGIVKKRNYWIPVHAKNLHKVFDNLKQINALESSLRADRAESRFEVLREKGYLYKVHEDLPYLKVRTNTPFIRLISLAERREKIFQKIAEQQQFILAQNRVFSQLPSPITLKHIFPDRKYKIAEPKIPLSEGRKATLKKIAEKKEASFKTISQDLRIITLKDIFPKRQISPSSFSPTVKRSQSYNNLSSLYQK